MSRNLYNSNTNDNIDGIPIIGNPQNEQILVYNNGIFEYSSFSSLGFNAATSSGIGESILKSTIGGVLNFKSIFGDENITISASSNEVIVNLKNELNLIQKIQNDPTTDLTIFISDEGASQLKKLKVDTKYGALEATFLELDNQGRLDLNTVTHLNSVVDGTVVADKFLGLDSNNKIVLSTTPGSDINAINFPNPTGWFFQKSGDTLEFRSYAAGQNINIGNLAGNVLFSVDNPLQEMIGINSNPPRSFNAPIYNPNNQYFYLGSSDIYFENLDILNQDKFLGIESDGKIVKRNALESVGSVGVGEPTYLDTIAGNARFRSFDSDGTLNITSTLETSYFGINPVQNTITDISQNGSSLYLNQSNLHAPNMTSITPVNVLGIDGLNKIGKTTAITSVANAGIGASVISSVTATTLTLKTFTSNNNSIVYGGNVSTNDLSLNPIQTSITDISQNAATLALNSATLKFPNISLQVPSILRKGLYFDTITKNVFYADVVKTITHSGTGTSLLNPTATGETPILKGLVAGSNITLSTTNSAITINASGASSSIYTADGTLNTTQRIVTGLNSGDIANNILWNDLIPGYNSSWMTPTNVPIANNSYSGINNPELMMTASGNGSQGKFMYAPYNYLSQRIEFKLGGVYGDQKTIFACFSNLNGTKDFIFTVDLYEAENHLDAFCATWEFSINSRAIINPNWYHVKPKTSSNIAYTGQENLVGLQIQDTVGVGGSGWSISFIQEGLGTGSYTSRYYAFIKCQHYGDGSMEIYDTAFAGVVSNNYLNDLYLLWENGISFPIATSFQYKNFGKDIKFTFNSNIQQTSGTGGVAIFEVYFNGQLVISANMSTNSVTNVNSGVSFTRIMKYVDLVPAGALNLGGATSVTFNQIGSFVSMNNFPYEILIEYY